MSFETISLGKLLIAFFADEPKRITLLRSDIRSQRNKEERGKTAGGEFYGPFWADAKLHVAGKINLRKATARRIERNMRRKRLYLLLVDAFLLWWEERRRLRNVPFTLIHDRIKSTVQIDKLGSVKIENTLGITVGDDGHRIFYPYFSPSVPLTDEAAKLGLWLMGEGIEQYRQEEMRIIDVFRSRSFSTLDTPLTGNEGGIFTEKYKDVLKNWQNLFVEYKLM